eukprot:3143748-Amphidinium_carterae.1
MQQRVTAEGDVEVYIAEVEELDLMQDDVYNDGGPEPASKPKARAVDTEMTQTQQFLATRLCYSQPSQSDLAAASTM